MKVLFFGSRFLFNYGKNAAELLINLKIIYPLNINGTETSIFEGEQTACSKKNVSRQKMNDGRWNGNPLYECALSFRTLICNPSSSTRRPVFLGVCSTNVQHQRKYNLQELFNLVAHSRFGLSNVGLLNLDGTTKCSLQLGSKSAPI